jgi:hypothetical protein
LFTLENPYSRHLPIPDDINWSELGQVVYPPCHMKQFGQIFFTEAVVVDGNWILWIYFLGSEDEAKKYFYTLTICHTDDKLQLHYSGQVTSMRQEFCAFIKRPKGLILTYEMVKSFMEDGCLNYKITLSEVKEKVDVENV